MNRTTNGFVKMSIPTFSYYLGVIVKSMTGNTHFPNLQTAVQALRTAADDYQDLVAKADSRDRNLILARDASRAAITDTLHGLGLDVSAVAKGDAEILASSGFPYTQPRKASPPLEKPAVPALSQGVNNGEIDCKTAAQPGLRSVNYYLTADAAALTAKDGTGWTIVSHNKTKFTFTDLVQGQRYYIKVGLVGVRGQEAISDAATYIAQ